jgi:hypothetical protein
MGRARGRQLVALVARFLTSMFAMSNWSDR